jgi:sugar/nucleoside kinase (ribokinase family)
MNPNYLTIGHIVQDLLPNGSYTPGGTVSFAALTAHRLGLRAGIVTACPIAVRQQPVFEGIEITGTISETVTVYENVYTPNGRVQFVHSLAPAITAKDIPQAWRESAEIVHLAPVAQEVAIEIADLFPNALIGVTPQGWMRAWSEDKRVYPVQWENAAKILAKSNVLVLGEEDLPAGHEGAELLKGYVTQCKTVVMTRAERGCTVFHNGASFNVPAFPAKIIDPTGAGDVFATAFFIKLRETGDPFTSARFANATAACNIEQIGLAGIPTLAQVQKKLATKD